MRSIATIEIDRPIDDVFRLTTEHVADWSVVVVEEEVLDQHPDGVGTTFRSVTEDHGKRMEFEGVVTRYEPPFVNAVHMKGKMFDIDTEFTFEDCMGSTLVTQTAEVTGKGLMKVFFVLCGWMMNKASCKASQIELENLKAYCESQPATAAT